MRKPVPLLLWDLDGTILDASLGILPALEEAFTNQGFSVPETTVLRQFVGPQILDSLANFTDIPLSEHHRILAEFKTNTYRKHFSKAELYPEVLELISEFHRRGFVQAIASQKPEHLVNEVLETYQLTHLFEIVSGSADDFEVLNQDLPRDKPGIVRRAIELAHAEFSVGTAVMIGDRSYDGEGAKSQGIAFIGVDWGYASEGELEQFNAPIAQNMDDLRRIIDNLVGSSKDLPVEKR